MITPKSTFIGKIIYPFKQFSQQNKSGGIVLGISVIVAFLLANSPWQSEYFQFFQKTFGFQIEGESYLNLTLHHWINDGLMAIFFFVIGLELKREIVSGELSNP